MQFSDEAPRPSDGEQTNLYSQLLTRFIAENPGPTLQFVEAAFRWFAALFAAQEDDKAELAAQLKVAVDHGRQQEDQIDCPACGCTLAEHRRRKV
jgi:hypothetical protein